MKGQKNEKPAKVTPDYGIWWHGGPMKFSKCVQSSS